MIKETMYVYVLSVGYDYEGDDIVGIYSSKAKVLEQRDKIEQGPDRIKKDYRRIQLIEVDKEVRYGNPHRSEEKKA
jgi:hypothetical protein